MTTDSPQYLKGKIAALEMVTSVLFNLLAEFTLKTAAAEADFRLQFKATLVELSSRIEPSDDVVYRRGFVDCLSEISVKLM